MQLRAHFDGRVLVPDEPVNLPVGQTLILFFNPEVDVLEFPLPAATPQERQAARNRFISGPVRRDTPLADEATRRENLYADDDEPL